MGCASPKAAGAVRIISISLVVQDSAGSSHHQHQLGCASPIVSRAMRISSIRLGLSDGSAGSAHHHHHHLIWVVTIRNPLLEALLRKNFGAAAGPTQGSKKPIIKPHFGSLLVGFVKTSNFLGLYMIRKKGCQKFQLFFRGDARGGGSKVNAKIRARPSLKLLIWDLI